MPVRAAGPGPAPGTTVLRRGQEAGEMRSAEDGLGLALLRLEHARAGDGALSAGEARLTPFVPAWMRLPAEGGAA
ncbi:MAG: folate-binding protein, partial [Rhodospirillaceae bacterium]|nr:folate-binding protein [Rhodospirillaceae bacterium]